MDIRNLRLIIEPPVRQFCLDKQDNPVYTVTYGGEPSVLRSIVMDTVVRPSSSSARTRNGTIVVPQA
jgi:hypothetical protein